MLNNNTRAVLSQLGAINNSMIISYPITTVLMGKNMQAFLDLRKLDEEGFEEIGVYNINELNSVINVIDTPDITNENGILTIKNDSRSIRYGTTSIDIIENDCRGKPELLDKIRSDKNVNVLNFEMSAKDLDNIKKMSGLLKDLSDLEISGNTENPENILLTVKSKEKSSNNFTMNLTGTVNENASMLLLIDIVNKLPSSAYNVNIYKSVKGSLIAIFSSINVDGLEIVLASKAV